MTMDDQKCTKIRYASAEQAKNAMRKMWRKKIGAGKLPTRVYRCPKCGGYHMTSRPRA
jgi:hypothetical protein